MFYALTGSSLAATALTIVAHFSGVQATLANRMLAAVVAQRSKLPPEILASMDQGSVNHRAPLRGTFPDGPVGNLRGLGGRYSAHRISSFDCAVDSRRRNQRNDSHSGFQTDSDRRACCSPRPFCC